MISSSKIGSTISYYRESESSVGNTLQASIDFDIPVPEILTVFTEDITESVEPEQEQASTTDTNVLSDAPEKILTSKIVEEESVVKSVHEEI